MRLDDGEQASITGSEVENAGYCIREEFEQCQFPLRAVSDRVGPAEIIEHVFLRTPEVNTDIQIRACLVEP
jgi:hypothetical protein